MSDRSLRELERRWRASGSLEDEVTWLRARVQAGLVPDERLELAAYLGSEAAGEVWSPRELRIQPPRTGVKGWVRKGLAEWGPGVCLRAAIAAARMIVSDADELPEEVCRVRLHLAEAFAVDPRPERVRELQAQPRIPLPEERRYQDAWWACVNCGWTLSVQLRSGGNQHAWKAKNTVERVAKAVKSEAKVRAAITAELLPWALGLDDPVEARLEARGGASGSG